MFTWNCDPTKLYTLTMSDKDGMAEGNEFLNYLVYNINKCNTSMGFKALDYMPPFSFEADPDFVSDDQSVGQLLEGSSKKTVFMYLVYEQKSAEPINMNIKQSNCTKDLFNAQTRVVSTTGTNYNIKKSMVQGKYTASLIFIYLLYTHHQAVPLKSLKLSTITK